MKARVAQVLMRVRFEVMSSNDLWINDFKLRACYQFLLLKRPRGFCLPRAVYKFRNGHSRKLSVLAIAVNF